MREGHPAQVMDMSFATQAMASERAAKSRTDDSQSPRSADRDRTGNRRVKLAAMSIEIDTLTAEQRKYLASWESGT